MTTLRSYAAVLGGGLTFVALIVGCTPGGFEPQPAAVSASPAATRPAIQPSPGDGIRTVVVAGHSRTYLLRVPRAITTGRPLPLLVDLHVGGRTAMQHRAGSGTAALADAEGFLAVYPDGTRGSWNGGVDLGFACCDFAIKNRIDDVGFIRAIIAELRAAGIVDPKRVFVAGFSQGGDLTYRLACELPDLIAAIAPVATSLSFDECRPASPVSVVHFHGDNDRILRRPLEPGIDLWVKRNACGDVPERETHGAVVVDTYTGCANGTAVTLYTIVGMGHSWPGAPAISIDPPTTDFNANRVMWDFFKVHPKA